MDFDLITTALKKGFDTFVQNIVAYIVGIILVFIGSIFIITSAPLMYSLYYMVLKGTRGEKVEIKDILYGFSSLSVFIRAWIGVIAVALVPFVISFIFSFVSTILVMISSSLAILVTLLSLVLMIVLIIFAIFIYFSLYIYVMTPSENIIYAIKESISIGKANIIMVLLTMIIASICSIFWITYPLGMLFAAYMLKELKPDLKDNSGL